MLSPLLVAALLTAQAPATSTAEPPVETAPPEMPSSDPAAEPAAQTPATTEDAPPTAPTTTPTTAPPPTPTAAAASSWQRTLGLSLVAGGAGVAAAGTAALTLVQALGTPDQEGAAPSDFQQGLTENSGFAIGGLVSLSAVVLVIGASLLLAQESAPNSTTTPNPTTPPAE